ncbi:hypothetical protein GGI07_001847 [Coemansia sp. Benny D115]|nr:hypothetical protein GGI07_001847 [Coemansia sp. Benny D115]
MAASIQHPMHLQSADVTQQVCQVHEILWALAESHFRQAQKHLQGRSSAAATQGDWRVSVLSGISCLFAVLRMCDPQGARRLRRVKEHVLGPEIEAKTRLRLAQVLAEWSLDNGRDLMEPDDMHQADASEEAQLVRALMVVPSTQSSLDTRYAIVATHCRLFVRRREYPWALQKLKAAAQDARQRHQVRWLYFFLLELIHLHTHHMSNVIEARALLADAIDYATKAGDFDVAAVFQAELFAHYVAERSWTNDTRVLAEQLADPSHAVQQGEMHPVKTRFWALQAAAMVMQGQTAAAQRHCDDARRALKDWQISFARSLAAQRVSDGGSSLAISGWLSIRCWSYFEAHAWVMLISACSARNAATDDASGQSQESGFLRLALEGIKRGESEGFRQQLVPTKVLVLLHVVDMALEVLQMEEAKGALDQIMLVVADDSHPWTSLWRRIRDAVVLRWAMYRHRVGDFAQAADSYMCVVNNGSSDLRYAALVNLATLRLTSPGAQDDPSTACAVQPILEALGQHASASEGARQAIHDFLSGLAAAQEPVRAKTHLLSCLRLCAADLLDTRLQGWTLCLLGSLVLSTGQYDQAMKMCGAGQAIAQKSGDPLQNASAIGILANIEKAVGDIDRCAQLLHVDRQLLERFNEAIEQH